MSNETKQSTIYRRMSDTTPSPVLRRSKSVRASFRMLGSRWKPSSNNANKFDNTPLKKEKKTDFISDRFGREFNQNVKKAMTETVEAPPPIKNKSKFFHAFAKENFSVKSFNNDIPTNVAPKAAALLQIPLNREVTTATRERTYNFHNTLNLDRNACDLIANSKQFKLLKSLTQNDNNIDQDKELFKPATIRRAPYWTNNLAYNSKI